MGNLSTSSIERFAQLHTNDFNRGILDTGDVFVLNPHNQNFIDGKTRRLGSRAFSNSPGCLVLFLLPFLAVGIFNIAWTIDQWQEFNALNQAGVEGNAEITEKRVSSSDDSDNYYLSYSYFHNDVRYEEEQSVSRKTYERTEIGAAVAIEYVPAQPSIAVLAGSNTFPAFPLIFMVCWNLFVWPLFLAIIVQMWSNRLLAKEGSLISGQIVSSTTAVEGEDDAFYLTLKYRFISPQTGENIIGSAKEQREDMRYKPMPRRETPLAVMYRNDKHHRPL